MGDRRRLDRLQARDLCPAREADRRALACRRAGRSSITFEQEASGTGMARGLVAVGARRVGPRRGRRPRRAPARSRAVVQDDQVGGKADVEPPELRAPSSPAGARSLRRPRPRAARRARAGSGPPRSSSARCRRARRQGRARCLRAPARRGPEAYSPSLAPARGDRVGDERDPPARRAPDGHAVSGARWTPSRISWTITSSRASAAPTMPGSRCRKAASR